MSHAGLGERTKKTAAKRPKKEPPTPDPSRHSRVRMGGGGKQLYSISLPTS